MLRNHTGTPRAVLLPLCSRKHGSLPPAVTGCVVPLRPCFREHDGRVTPPSHPFTWAGGGAGMAGWGGGALGPGPREAWWVCSRHAGAWQACSHKPAKPAHRACSLCLRGEGMGPAHASGCRHQTAARACGGCGSAAHTHTHTHTSVQVCKPAEAGGRAAAVCRPSLGGTWLHLAPTQAGGCGPPAVRQASGVLQQCCKHAQAGRVRRAAAPAMPSLVLGGHKGCRAGTPTSITGSRRLWDLLQQC